MSSCNRCGKTLHGLLPASLCPECKSIERDRENDREREEEREERAASNHSEMLDEIDRSKEQSREDIAAAAAYIANAKNNPGDYVCPSCLFRTLKKEASRCSKCHADIGRQYWDVIKTKERDARVCALAAKKAAKESDEKWAREQLITGEALAKLKKLKDKKSKSFIFSLIYSLTGKIEKATSNLNKAVELYQKSIVEIKSHDGITTLMGHSNGVQSVAFSPDGKLLASNSSNEFLLWSVAERQYMGSLTPRSYSGSCAAFSPDGKLIASAGDNHSVKLWAVADRLEVATLRGHTGWPMSVKFSPDGKLLASGGMDNSLILWSVASRRRVATLTGHNDCVSSVAFSSDGKLLASGSYDGTVKLWSVNESQEVATLTGHRDQVSTVTFSPDGKLLASGGHDGIVKLWSVAERREVTNPEVVKPFELKLLLPNENWEKSTNLESTLMEHSGYIESVVFSPDGKLLASGGMYNELKLWSVAKLRIVTTLSEQGDVSIESLAFSPDGKLLASGGSDHCVKLWEITASSDL